MTGATSGIGFYSALALGQSGFDLTLAVRDVEKGERVAARIRQDAPEADIEVKRLDLSSLYSIREFAADYLVAHGSWDTIVNNAGAKLIQNRMLTEDGFEWHFGVNHLGHFALNGLLIHAASDRARIITVSSLTYRSGRIRFHDLRWDHGYRSTKAYAMSKLANLVYGFELHRRLQSADYPDYPSRVRSIVVHPGFTKAEPYGPLAVRLTERAIAQSAVDGAEPTIFAALNPGLIGGEFIGPSGPGQLRGEPKVLDAPKISHDMNLALRLWRISNQLTRVNW